MNPRLQKSSICVLLMALVWLVYGQTLRHEFVNFDDAIYVADNAELLRPLTWKGVGWEFTHAVNANYHPLTMLSYMLDYKLYGLNAGGYHLTNIQFHIAAVIALFLVLESMTGMLLRSAFVAALFAIHPLHVESVAWVSERKDVLSSFFFMLTLGAYAWYCRRPGIARYTAVFLLSALGLMCKPMLVTIPGVLLLLDYWPLDRSKLGIKRLLLEKAPLIALSVACCVVAVLTQRAAEAIKEYPLPLRISNALVSFVTYIVQTIWPVGMAAYYPYRKDGIPFMETAIAFCVLAAISATAFALRRRKPYVLAGWLWYVGMLVPVIGIIQVGRQARADRYMYLPQIGLFIAATWAAGDVSSAWRHRRLTLGFSACAVTIALALVAHLQASYWHDSKALWSHAIAAAPSDWIAHRNYALLLLRGGEIDAALREFRKTLPMEDDRAEGLDDIGNALFQKGEIGAAIEQYKEALKISPDHAKSHDSLGEALLRMGKAGEAIPEFTRALELDPPNAQTEVDLGVAFYATGRLDAAVDHLQKAVNLKPNLVEGHLNLGAVWHARGEFKKAITEYELALGFQPSDAQVHYNLGNALLEEGKPEQAASHLEKALESQPAFAPAMNRLAWVLATSTNPGLRDPRRAVDLALRANEISNGGNPDFLRTLAEAYAADGQFPAAIAAGRRALKLATAQGNTSLADALGREIRRYEADDATVSRAGR